MANPISLPPTITSKCTDEVLYAVMGGRGLIGRLGNIVPYCSRSPLISCRALQTCACDTSPRKECGRARRHQTCPVHIAQAGMCLIAQAPTMSYQSAQECLPHPQNTHPSNVPEPSEPLLATATCRFWLAISSLATHSNAIHIKCVLLPMFSAHRIWAVNQRTLEEGTVAKSQNIPNHLEWWASVPHQKLGNHQVIFQLCF